MTHYSTDPVRRAEARRRLVVALAEPNDNHLSDVFFDAAHDGTEWPDGEGGWSEHSYGFDCDDLAAVIGPLLRGSQTDSEVGA